VEVAESSGRSSVAVIEIVGVVGGDRQLHCLGDAATDDQDIQSALRMIA